MPLLVVAVAIAVYFRIKASRAKGREQRAEFTAQLDQRMSRISTDWKSMTGAGANAAIRASMAENRMSTFSYGAPRPSTTTPSAYAHRLRLHEMGPVLPRYPRYLRIDV